MSKHLLLFLGILLLGGFLRFTWLDAAPNSINGDQMHYILDSKAFVLTGKDITQRITPLDILTFRYVPGEFPQAEALYLLNMLTVGFLPFSLTTSSLASIISSFLLIILMYVVAKKLFNNNGIALAAAYLTAVNPWIVAIGRTSYEMVVADFFYLLVLYILLVTKKWKILFSIPVIMLAFYSYIATKLPFLPIILAYCVYSFSVVNKKKFALQYGTVLLIAILFVGFFAFQIFTSHAGTRATELITPFSPYVTAQVDWIRKLSIDSPLLPIFVNKFTVFVMMVTKSLLETISPIYLFINGDLFFLQGKYGLFHPIDSVFLLFGMVWVFAKNKKLFFFLFMLTALSLTPHIFHKTSILNGNFSPHTTLLVPFLILFMAAGVYQILTFVAKNKIALTAILALFVITIGNFINVYFFQMPLQSEYYNFSNRLLSRYISLNKDKHITVYIPDEKGKFKEHLFYANLYTKSDSQKISDALRKKKYAINNVSFVSCNKGVKTFSNKEISIFHTACGMDNPPSVLAISQLSDSGDVYKIVNDTLCKKYSLKPFISGLKLNDFSVEKLSPEQFCHTFILTR